MNTINKIDLIAEIGWNFMGNLKLAEKMIKAAKSSGATYAKFQYWNPNKLKDGPWMKDGRYEIYKKAFLDKDKLLFLKSTCNKYNIKFLCSVFSVEDASFVKNLKINNIKVPSHEIYNSKLHQFVVNNFNKIFVSLGAGTKSEIIKACNIYKKHPNWTPMHCVASYPCELQNINLSQIAKYQKYSKIVGFSDHTQEIITPAFAIIQGARVIEKHFTSNNNLPGRDNKFALNPKKFLEMKKMCDLALLSVQKINKFPQKSELDILNNYRGRWG